MSPKSSAAGIASVVPSCSAVRPIRASAWSGYLPTFEIVRSLYDRRQGGDARPHRRAPGLRVRRHPSRAGRDRDRPVRAAALTAAAALADPGARDAGDRPRRAGRHDEAGAGGVRQRPGGAGAAGVGARPGGQAGADPASYTHLRAHETKANLVCRLLLEKKKKTKRKTINRTLNKKKKQKKKVNKKQQ